MQSTRARDTYTYTHTGPSAERAAAAGRRSAPIVTRVLTSIPTRKKHTRNTSKQKVRSQAFSDSERAHLEELLLLCGVGQECHELREDALGLGSADAVELVVVLSGRDLSGDRMRKMESEPFTRLHYSLPHKHSDISLPISPLTMPHKRSDTNNPSHFSPCKLRNGKLGYDCCAQNTSTSAFPFLPFERSPAYLALAVLHGDVLEVGELLLVVADRALDGLNQGRVPCREVGRGLVGGRGHGGCGGRGSRRRRGRSLGRGGRTSCGRRQRNAKAAERRERIRGLGRSRHGRRRRLRSGSRKRKQTKTHEFSTRQAEQSRPPCAPS